MRIFDFFFISQTCVTMCGINFVQKAETADKEKSKASTVAINAEIRRTKARLLEEVPKLQRLAMKKVGTMNCSHCI